ncbi:MAG TPA: hypothetical protein VFO82_02530 [Steroidobacteraceae bacterium]|nr:hypothetical protein [Steroidobacteraceae bacterium]
MEPPRRPKRSNHWPDALAGFAVLLLAPTAQAIDSIVLEVRELTIAGMPVTGASARLDLVSDQRARVTLNAHEVSLPDPAGKFSSLVLVCEQPVIAEPRFGCEAGRLTARGGPTGALDMQVRAELRSDTGVTTFAGKGVRIAGTTASFDGRLDERGWQVRGSTAAAKISELRRFATPWFVLPADITGDGQVKLEGTLADAGAGLVADVRASFEGVDLTNEASTIVTDKLAGAVRLRMEPRGADSRLALEVRGRGGQLLFTPVYYDLGTNPLELQLNGRLAAELLTIDSLHLRQDKLLDMTGAGRLNLAGETASLSGEFRLARVEFPAAFAAYAANFLATSMIGDAQTRGSLSGELSIEDNALTALHVKPEKLDFSANKGSLHLEGMNGQIHWAPAGGRDAQVSTLDWTSGGAYGLSGGASGIEFVAYGANFALTRPAKLPVFDGAIAIEHFVMGNLGAPDMEVSFKGDVEPISMPLLAKAFGWPEFAGTIAASIPGVRLKDNVLTFDGNVESQVFGGRIEGSNIRLKDPLGNYPEFFADVRARDLDLELVTRTFEVGTITGRLEADVLGLRLFGWTPTSFDARLETPKGDKSRHRISARAVSSLSNVGGGGGSVVQALQSGVLRFFDDYSYDKLGIRCRLVADVCEMSGIEPAPNGYYIVKGAGIPRIDIVGNQGRVNWNSLMSSIATADFGGTTVK